MDINHYSNKNKVYLLSRFLIYCSGARLSILKMSLCSDEREKYARIGSIILLVSLSAFVSFSYAAWTVIHNWQCMLCGLWGALFIFNIDRTIVAESPKTINSNKKSLFLFIFIRLLLALIISFVITVPIHLLIFSGPISDYLNTQNQSDALVAEVNLQAQYPEIKVLKQRNISLEDELKMLREERKNAHKEMIKEGTGQKGIGLTGKIGVGLSYELRKREFEDKDHQYNERKKVIESEVSENSKNILSKENELDKKRKYSDKTRSDNNSLPTQLSALHDISKKNHMIDKASWGITLLFVGLDSTPVLLKVLSKRGLYDSILEAKDREAIYNEDEEHKSSLLLMDKKNSNQRKKDKLVLEHDYEIFVQIETISKNILQERIMDISVKSTETEEWGKACNKAMNEYVYSLSKQLSEYSNIFQLSEKEVEKYLRPELLKNAEKYAKPFAEEEMKRRQISKDKDDLIKLFKNKVEEIVVK
jgi:cell division protein FtsB